MNWIKAAISELFSLFVDDVWFSVSILAWVAFSAFGLPTFPIDPVWNAPLIFLGCALILLISTWRAARTA